MSAMRTTMIVLTLQFLVLPAFAQTNLPPSDPGSSQYNSVYLPAHGVGDTVQQGPIQKWADRWGAIATDAENAKLGVATDVSSKRLAERSALKDCEDEGGINCVLEMSYYNQCAALVVSEKMMNTWRAETLQIVEGLALSDCKKRNSNCRIYYSACSLPERVQ